MKLALFTTAFAALASVGFAESSTGVNHAGAAVTNTLGAASTTEDAPAGVLGGVTTADKSNQKRRGLGKKAEAKDRELSPCKLCCNDDDRCG